MFSADHIEFKKKDITLESIQSSVSEYDIFKLYCKSFKDIGIAFTSEFYDDGKASCYVYQDSSNRLKYKDFGSGDSLDCYAYIMKKYNCTFGECLRIIASDFGMSNTAEDIPREFILGVNSNYRVKPKFKPKISIIPRGWNLQDKEYWFKKYSIDFNILEEYDVIPLEYCYLHKEDKTIVFKYDKSNPMYAYRFTRDGCYSYKIYWPLHPDKKRKWLFSGGAAEDIEGFDQLPLIGDLLIITKSLKDVICCKLCGYNAISLQGEANRLESSLVQKLYKRFTKIIVFYDNDGVGIAAAHKISVNYSIDSIIIPNETGAKDLSDLIESKGIEYAKLLLNKLIDEKTKDRV